MAKFFLADTLLSIFNFFSPLFSEPIKVSPDPNVLSMSTRAFPVMLLVLLKTANKHHANLDKGTPSRGISPVPLNLKSLSPPRDDYHLTFSNVGGCHP